MECWGSNAKPASLLIIMRVIKIMELLFKIGLTVFLINFIVFNMFQQEFIQSYLTL